MSWLRRYAARPKLRFFGSAEAPFASYFPPGKTRDYVEISGADGEPSLSREDEDVIWTLREHGYSLDAKDYVAGLAASPGGRKIRIGKALARSVADEAARLRSETEKRIAEISEEDEARAELVRDGLEAELRESEAWLSKLQKWYVNSPARQAKHRDRVYMVVSREPEDILNMSTGRDWTSCMDQEGGGYAGDARREAEAGSLVAYAVREGDRYIENPLARIHIKRFQDMAGNNVAMAEDSVYGQHVEGFAEAVRKWLDDRQGAIPPGVYRRIGGKYSDTFGSSEVILPTDPQQLYELAMEGIDESEYTRYRVVSRIPDEAGSWESDEERIVAEFATEEEAKNYISDRYYDDSWRDYYGGEWLETDEFDEYVEPPAEIEKVVHFHDDQARLEALTALATMPAESISAEQAAELVRKYSERAKERKFSWGRALAELILKYPDIASMEDLADYDAKAAVRYVSNLPEGREKDMLRSELAEDAAAAAANVVSISTTLAPHQALSFLHDALRFLSASHAFDIWSEDHQPPPKAVSEIVAAAIALYENGPVERLPDSDGLLTETDESWPSRYLLAAGRALADAHSDLPETAALVSRLVSEWMPVEEEVALSGSIGKASLVPSVKTMSSIMAGIGTAARQFLPEIARRASEARKIYEERKAAGASGREVMDARRVWEAYLWIADTVESGERSKKYRLRASSWLERSVTAAECRKDVF